MVQLIWASVVIGKDSAFNGIRNYIPQVVMLLFPILLK